MMNMTNQNINYNQIYVVGINVIYVNVVKVQNVVIYHILLEISIHECCTKRNLYAIKFPENMNDSDKATLMGAALIYDMTLNEQNA